MRKESEQAMGKGLIFFFIIVFVLILCLGGYMTHRTVTRLDVFWALLNIALLSMMTISLDNPPFK